LNPTFGSINSLQGLSVLFFSSSIFLKVEESYTQVCNITLHNVPCVFDLCVNYWDY